MKLAGILNAERFACGLAAAEWIVSAAPGRVYNYAFALRTGNGQAVLFDGEIAFRAPCVVWLAAGTALRCSFQAGSAGAMFRVSDDFLRRLDETGGEARDLQRLWGRSVVAGGEQLVPVSDEIHTSFAALEREMCAPRRASSALAAAHLTVILLHVGRIAGVPAAVRESPTHHSLVVERFLDLVEAHVTDHWTVAQYAAALDVSHDRLQATCTRITGRGPLAHIHARAIDEARGRLVRSMLPIETIAAELGFADPRYFNRFFKKNVGQSPGAFRRQAIAASLAAASFATWP